LRRPIGDEFDNFSVLENSVTLESVEIHTRHLPRGVTSDFRPFPRRNRQSRQHLERNIRHFQSIAVFETLVAFDDFRQLIGINVAPINKRKALRASRPSVSGEPFSKRRRKPRRLPDGLFENLFRLTRLEPFAHQAFRKRTERFTPRAPLRIICTKFLSIFPLSMTRGKSARKQRLSFVESTATRSAGISFINHFRARKSQFSPQIQRQFLATARTLSSCSPRRRRKYAKNNLSPHIAPEPLSAKVCTPLRRLR
jgi:hypothetical protein